MNRPVNRLVHLCVLAAVAASAAGTASAITITATSPFWSVSGGTQVQPNLPNGDFLDVRWGFPASSGGKSGLGFDPVNPPAMDVPENTIFHLGTLRHYNVPTSGTPPAFADLSLSTIIDGATPTMQVFAFRFLISETSNSGLPANCPFPSTVACSDRIGFQNLDTSAFFTLGGEDYTLELIGFSQDGGSTFTDSFVSEEFQINDAQLYARFVPPTRPTPVPEPATLSMLGAGLLGLAFLRRRKAAVV